MIFLPASKPDQMADNEVVMKLTKLVARREELARASITSIVIQVPEKVSLTLHGNLAACYPTIQALFQTGHITMETPIHIFFGDAPEPIVIVDDNDKGLAIELARRMLQQIRKEHPVGAPLHLYCGGEADGSQTRFERQSNHLEIGVTAASLEEARVLLRLLRIHVDNNYSFLCDFDDIEEVVEEIDEGINLHHPQPDVIVNTYTGRKHLSMSDVLKVQRESDAYISTSPSVDVPIRSELVDGSVIEKRWDQVDTYSLERLIEIYSRL